MKRYYIFIAALIVFSLLAAVANWASQRGIIADQHRISDLAAISNKIIYNDPQAVTLPTSLSDLNVPDLYYPLSDYDYTVTASNGFRLCATFATITHSTNNSGSNDAGYPDTSVHGKGQQCFTYKDILLTPGLR